MDVIETGAVGYALCRGFPQPVPVPGGLWMEVGAPDQRGRIVLRNFDPVVVVDLMRRITAPAVYFEIPADVDEATAFVGPAWAIQNRAYLMTLDDITRQTAAGVPGGYRMNASRGGGVITVAVHEPGGGAIASGYCAVFGSTCVFDRIVTRETHRRRGLGAR